MKMFDRCFLDDASQIRITVDGYLTARPRVARTGIQQYLGSEVGRPDLKVVNIFRPEEEVFKTDAMSSLAHKPITNDHPPVAVTADNWKKYGVGQADGDVVRDGEFVRVPMVLMDARAVRDVKNGKAELSVGYDCNLVWEAGEYNGMKYDARQTNIHANHIAVVDAARGGDKLRIGDSNVVVVDNAAFIAAVSAIVDGKISQEAFAEPLKDYLAIASDSNLECPFMSNGIVYTRALEAGKKLADAAGDTGKALSASIASLLKLIKTRSGDRKMTERTILVDGISCTMSDMTAGVVERAIKALGDSVADLTAKLTAANASVAKITTDGQSEVAKLTTESAAKDAKIVTLEKTIADAALTPAKIDALVADRMTMVNKVKTLLPTLVVDGKSDGDIRRAVVDAKLGDLAKGWTDDQVKTSFDTIAAGVTATNDGGQQQQQQATRPGFSQAFAHNDSSNGVSVADMDKLRAEADKRLTDAWKAPNGGHA